MMVPESKFGAVLHYLQVISQFQVAKSHGGSNAANQVAYLWAKNLGQDINLDPPVYPLDNRGQTLYTATLQPFLTIPLCRGRECSKVADQVWSPRGCC